MKETLYHGSKSIVGTPIYRVGKLYNDYGLGFYCTREADMAREWSVGYNQSGYVNKYSIETEDLHILNLSDGHYNILHWLAILIENRTFDVRTDFAVEAKEYLLEHFLPCYENADIIIGYRADDSYFSFAQDFISNSISLRTLSKAMRLGKLGEQVVIKSEKAFDLIRFEGYEYVPAEEWFLKKELRDDAARMEYREIRRAPREKDDLYMIQILNEEIDANDSRIW